MLLKEVIAVYTENHSRPIDAKCIITDRYSRWDMQLPLSFKRLNCDMAVSSYECDFFGYGTM
jgi:hypothetical protein